MKEVLGKQRERLTFHHRQEISLSFYPEIRFFFEKMGNGFYFDRPSQEKSHSRKRMAFFSEIRLRRVKYGFAM